MSSPEAQATIDDLAARLMLGVLSDCTCSVAVLVGHLQFRHLLDQLIADGASTQ